MLIQLTSYRFRMAAQTLLCTILMCGFVMTVAAQEETGEAEPVEPKEEKLRDPFSPVGHAPEGTRKPRHIKTDEAEKIPVPVAGVDWAGAEKTLKVTGLSTDPAGVFFAVVNGNIVSAGDSITVQVREYNYRWTIKSLDDKNGMRLDRQRVAPYRKRKY